jgi:hypothetical protein
VDKPVGGPRIGERIEGRQGRLHDAWTHTKKPSPQWRLTLRVSMAGASRLHHAGQRRRLEVARHCGVGFSALANTPKGAHT